MGRKIVLEAINSIDNGIIAVHYGKSDNRVAGESGFEQFYQEYQDELDTIGKRPDILVALLQRVLISALHKFNFLKF